MPEIKPPRRRRGHEQPAVAEVRPDAGCRHPDGRRGAVLALRTRYGTGKTPLTDASKYIDLKYYDEARRG